MENKLGNLTEVILTTEQDRQSGKDLEILYGLAGNDFLGAVDGATTENDGDATVLVGGSGGDHYDTNNLSTAIIIENGNSDRDVFLNLYHFVYLVL